MPALEMEHLFLLKFTTPGPPATAAAECGAFLGLLSSCSRILSALLLLQLRLTRQVAELAWLTVAILAEQ